MIDWLTDAARRRPDHHFLVARDETVSFATFDDRVWVTAGQLAEHPVAGSIVGLWATNTVGAIANLFALWRAGASVLLVDPRLPTEESGRHVGECGAQLLVSDDGDVNLGVPTWVPSPDGPHHVGVRRESHETALVVFTSGTTGRAKGVVLTFGNLEASAGASAEILGHGADDRWLCNLPISHVGGASILTRSVRQSTTVVLEPNFDARASAALLSDGRVTMASMVSATLAQTLDELHQRCRGVRVVLVGGGPVPDGLIHRAHEMGLPAVPTYGMTETASQIATAKIGATIGSSISTALEPLPGVEIAIRDDGRVLVRGPMVSPGYIGEPSRAVDEWLITGDFGHADALGRLEVLGRADDVIVSGGENVNPVEIEAALQMCRGVDEVVVVGLPDPSWGSIVTAVYVGSASAGELERHARYHLAGSNVPRRWVHAGSIPHLPNGKIDRQATLAFLI